MSEKLEAPNYLSEKSRKLWESVSKRAKSPEKLELINVALKNLDFADECEKIIKKEGLTITTPKSGCSHLHPLFKSMKESQQLFIKIWISLGFKFDPSGPIQRWP
jgi:phage terminase small subunit